MLILVFYILLHYQKKSLDVKGFWIKKQGRASCETAPLKSSSITRQLRPKNLIAGNLALEILTVIPGPSVPMFESSNSPS